MVNWLVVGVVLLAIFVVSKLIHFRNIKHKIVTVIIILLLFFTYTTFASVVTNHEIDIKSATGVYQAVKIYASWFGVAFNNFKTLTGNAINLDWAPSLSGDVVKDTDSSSKGSGTKDIEYA